MWCSQSRLIKHISFNLYFIILFKLTCSSFILHLYNANAFIYLFKYRKTQLSIDIHHIHLIPLVILFIFLFSYFLIFLSSSCFFFLCIDRAVFFGHDLSFISSTAANVITKSIHNADIVALPVFSAFFQF